MPFSTAFKEERPLIVRAWRIRQNPIAAYGIAASAVIIAAVLRWVLGGHLMDGIPFITYYPAIVIATLFGGYWPGIFATLLSAAISWFVFFPPSFSWELTQHDAISLLLFIVSASISVVLMAFMNTAGERAMAQEQNVQVLLESAPNGIVVIDEEGTITRVNATIERLFGYNRHELLGRKIEVLVPDRQVDTHRAVRESFLQKPEARMMGAGRELSGRRKEGSEFPVEIGLNPVSRNGRNAVLATVIDISERKRADDRQQFLIRELQHRTQNLFAVIQSIANRSLMEGHTLAEAKEVLNGRLHALAQAHSMLADAAWEGAPLAEMIKRELAGFSKQLSLSGCDIVVNTPAAQQFALMVHELATNAVKYGALSVPDGRISIECNIERANGDGTFSFLWKETGGPIVSVPKRKGFGSVILLDEAKQFGQHVALNYDPQGLSYERRFPLSAIEAATKQEGSAAIAEHLAG
jgi:PAS domain S-box-containing protein